MRTTHYQLPLLLSRLFLVSLLACLGLVVFNQPAAAQIVKGSGASPTDSYLVLSTDSIYVAPPATYSAGLTFSGIATRRYQPINTALPDDPNPSLYTAQVEVDSLNEWAITLYDTSGNLQMTTATISGTPTQVFSLAYQKTDVFKNLYSAKADLDDMLPPVPSNIRADQTIFKLGVDYLFRTHNNVEWRFGAQPFYYQINSDLTPPELEIQLNGVVNYGPETMDYNDSSQVFSLHAKDPDTFNSSPVTKTGLNEYRYQWFRNAGTSADTCDNFWSSASASATWQPAQEITPGFNGFYEQDQTVFANQPFAQPGSYSLCFQVSDNVGNIGSAQGKYWFTLPEYISLNCFDYQSTVLGTCTGSDCLTLTMNNIPGYGQSSLATKPGVSGTNVGNTISCHVQTNSQVGYDLNISSVQPNGDMVNSHNVTPIPTSTATTLIPASWPTLTNDAVWALRLHSASGTDLYSVATWGTDDYVGGRWAGINGSPQTLYRRDSNLTTSDDHTVVSADDRPLIQFGAETTPGYNAVADVYKVNLVVTAVSLP